jgi:hypothetical protein
MYKPIKTIKVKQGNPLSLFYHYQNDDLTDMDLSIHEIKCYLKNADKKLISYANINPIDLKTGKFNVEVYSVPLIGDGVLFLDVKISLDGKSYNNDIIKIIVSEVVTHD